MKKTLLLIVPSLIQGGFERVCVDTANYVKDEMNVKIVLFDSTKTFYDTGDIEIVDLNKPSVDSRIGKLFNVLARALAVKKAKQKYKADIAMSFGPSASLPNVLSRVKGCETWVNLRSYMDLSNHRQMSLFCDRADRVICCSKGIEKEIRDNYNPGRTDTVYNPFNLERTIDLSKAKEKLPLKSEEEFIVSTMGRDDEVKGYWHLIKAFGLFKKKIPKAKLRIIGMGDFKECKELAADLGISDSVEFTGALKNPYPMLKQSDMYVLSSINEGFPNALIEAMALDLPVVSTDCLTGPSEILADELSKDIKEVKCEKYGILVPRVSDVPDYNSNTLEPEDCLMAEGMIKLASDAELLSKYKEASRRRVNDFSPEKYIECMFNLRI